MGAAAPGNGLTLPGPDINVTPWPENVQFAAAPPAATHLVSHREPHVPTVPPYLKEFGDEDARWLHEHGVLVHLRARERVIAEGVTPEHLYVVLEGEFRVSSESMGDPDMLRARPGELLGEMSYIHGTAPGASVIAVTNSVVLALRRADVDAQIARDPAFGSRFRKVLMDFAVNRMWQYNRRDWNPPPAEPEADPYAELKVHELIEKLLRGEF